MPRSLRDEVLRWSLAALAVAFVHAAVAGAVLLWKKSESFAEPAAAPILVELSPLPVAPEAEPTDIAPGPEMSQSSPSMRVEPEKKLTETIPDSPVPEPEVALDRQDAKEDRKKPDPKKQTAKAEPDSKDKDPPAPQTTAPPRIKAKRAPRIAAPRIGLTSSTASQASWRSALVAHLNRHKRYPGDAGGATGTAVLRFSIDRNGRVTGYSLARSSGSGALDREVLAMIQRANPLPPPPPDVGGSQFSFGVPVRFNVR